MKSIASPDLHANVTQWLSKASSSRRGSQLENQPEPMDSSVAPNLNSSEIHSPPPSSSRILYDIPCKVCRDHSSGKHYGIFACDGCAGFFKRSIRRSRQYACKSKTSGTCIVDKAHRNQCRACRLTKCIDAGMNKEAVQHERGPRNSTLRRQMSIFLKDPHISQNNSNTPMPACQTMLPVGLVAQPVLAEEAACEAAARLLFMNVRWAKKVGAFNALPLPDRILLLSESWSDLFILGAVPLLTPLLIHNHSMEALAFCDIVESVARAQLDINEMACLRALALFQPSAEAAKSLSDPHTITALHQHAHIGLNKYVILTHPSKPIRFGTLMMLLPSMKMISSTIIEDLFFRKTIGNIPITRIISDMYTNTKEES